MYCCHPSQPFGPHSKLFGGNTFHKFYTSQHSWSIYRTPSPSTRTRTRTRTRHTHAIVHAHRARTPCTHARVHVHARTHSPHVSRCGHATLASAHHIFTVYPELLDISFNTKSGVLTAKKDANGSGRIVLDFPEELVRAGIGIPHVSIHCVVECELVRILVGLLRTPLQGAEAPHQWL